MEKLISDLNQLSPPSRRKVMSLLKHKDDEILAKNNSSDSSFVLRTIPLTDSSQSENQPNAVHSKDNMLQNQPNTHSVSGSIPLNDADSLKTNPLLT